MKIVASRDLCDRYGNCVIAAPTVFDVDDNGIVVVLDDELRPATESAVHRAIADCPARAIALAE